jgi:phosphoglycolate phosphatase-like HAD superfamily hydrolase
MGLEPDGFDLDMTLIDSRRAIVAAFAAFAAFAAVSRDTGTRIGLREVDSRLVIKLEDKLDF